MLSHRLSGFSVLLIVAVLFGTPAYAVDVVGNVSDLVSHSSLSGCTVRIFELDLTTQSDSFGDFVFLDVPEGVYTIMIGHADYRPTILANVRVTTGCCGAFTLGFTGNTNCDTEGTRNLADITRLIDNVSLG